MATGQNINTYFQGTWQKGNPAIINAADHGAWLGSNVFDGARYFNGVAPDLLAHCERVNNSAKALMMDYPCARFLGNKYLYFDLLPFFNFPNCRCSFDAIHLIGNIQI